MSLDFFKVRLIFKAIINLALVTRCFQWILNLYAPNEALEPLFFNQDTHMVVAIKKKKIF